MSFHHLTLLRTREDIKGPARAALFVLADRADENGECWVGLAKIAKESGFSRTTVKKHLKALKIAGEITWTQRFNGDGERDSNLYKLTLEGRAPDAPPRAGDAPPRTRGGGGVGRELADGRAGADHKAPIKHPSEAPKEKEGVDSVDLVSIVETYPRRQDIVQALEHVRASVRKGADPSAILTGTRAIAAVIKQLPSGHNNAYVVSAATFFKNERWRDDPQSWIRTGSKNGAAIKPLNLGGRAPASITRVNS